MIICHTCDRVGMAGTWQVRVHAMSHISVQRLRLCHPRAPSHEYNPFPVVVESLPCINKHLRAIFHGPFPRGGDLCGNLVQTRHLVMQLNYEFADQRLARGDPSFNACIPPVFCSVLYWGPAMPYPLGEHRTCCLKFRLRRNIWISNGCVCV